MNRKDNTDKRNMKEVIKRRNSFISASAVSSSGFMLKEDWGREKKHHQKNPKNEPGKMDNKKAEFLKACEAKIRVFV